MNCKKGDLAVVVRPQNATACARSRLGLVIKCETPIVGWDGNAFHTTGQLRAVSAWMLPQPIRCRECGGFVYGLADSTLKPLPPENDVWVHDYAQEEKRTISA